MGRLEEERARHLELQRAAEMKAEESTELVSFEEQQPSAAEQKEAEQEEHARLEALQAKQRQAEAEEEQLEAVRKAEAERQELADRAEAALRARLERLQAHGSARYTMPTATTDASDEDLQLASAIRQRYTSAPSSHCGALSIPKAARSIPEAENGPETPTAEAVGVPQSTLAMGPNATGDEDICYKEPSPVGHERAHKLETVTMTKPNEIEVVETMSMQGRDKRSRETARQHTMRQTRINAGSSLPAVDECVGDAVGQQPLDGSTVRPATFAGFSCQEDLETTTSRPGSCDGSGQLSNGVRGTPVVDAWE